MQTSLDHFEAGHRPLEEAIESALAKVSYYREGFLRARTQREKLISEAQWKEARVALATLLETARSANCEV